MHVFLCLILIAIFDCDDGGTMTSQNKEKKYILAISHMPDFKER
jgi:predicted MPP superfamily phosphohydrolase